ncbi:MAG: DUF308 domain-containing protein [Clostridia bacterium]|nr:DUF308 domain-containing protein [Clostridia bacterium]
MSEKLKSIFKSYLIIGLVFVALGVIMLIWPDKSLKILCIVLGVLFAIVGLVMVMTYILSKRDDAHSFILLSGLIQIALGIALMAKPEFFIEVFQIFIGIIMLYGCVLMFIHAYQLKGVKGPIYWLSIIFATITLALSVIMLINPSAFASFIVQLEGVALVVEGLSMIICLHDMRTAESKIEKEKKLIEAPKED